MKKKLACWSNKTTKVVFYLIYKTAQLAKWYARLRFFWSTGLLFWCELASFLVCSLPGLPSTDRVESYFIHCNFFSPEISKVCIVLLHIYWKLQGWNTVNIFNQLFRFRNLASTGGPTEVCLAENLYIDSHFKKRLEQICLQADTERFFIHKWFNVHLSPLRVRMVEHLRYTI